MADYMGNITRFDMENQAVQKRQADALASLAAHAAVIPEQLAMLAAAVAIPAEGGDLVSYKNESGDSVFVLRGQ